MIATIGFMAVSNTYAQTIPDPAWPLDTVIRTSVHSYTVNGDQNYDEASTFTWHVFGGRLFLDPDLTVMAGDGETATVTGSETNSTHIWVVWDALAQPSYMGYVYVTEKSANGCERAVTDPGRYQGMNIRVIAPPDVRFLTDITNVCSNETDVSVQIALKGLTPINLVYSINGDTIRTTITDDDLVDSDLDGIRDNISILFNDFYGTPDYLKYELKLIESSSAGIKGRVLPNYPTHTVNVFVQPDAPVIDPSPTEVTAGNRHQYSLSYDGENVYRYYWELYDSNGQLYHERVTNEPSVPLQFDYPPGVYNFICYYIDNNGCASESDTLSIEIFGDPTIAFADLSGNVISCSALDTEANDSFEFTVDYYGARAYDFTYAVYDYNNVMVFDSLVEFQMNRAVTIVIPNTFINDEIPDVARAWKVVILNSINEENKVVTVIDGNIAGGRDERTITIHPKPIITEDIDFAN